MVERIYVEKTPAFAQEEAVPFDMSGERGPAVETKPAEGDGKPATVETRQPDRKAATPDPAARNHLAN